VDVVAFLCSPDSIAPESLRGGAGDGGTGSAGGLSSDLARAAINLLPELDVLLRSGVLREVDSLWCMGTLDTLANSLASKLPSVLHFSGHGVQAGGGTSLVLTPQMGLVEAVAGTTVANALWKHQSGARTRLECCVLNACHVRIRTRLLASLPPVNPHPPPPLNACRRTPSASSW